jgi:glutathione synthase
VKFAFIIDPLSKLDPGHDTSVALMEASQALGHEVWVTQAQELSVVNGQAWALLQAGAANASPTSRRALGSQ